MAVPDAFRNQRHQRPGQRGFVPLIDKPSDDKRNPNRGETKGKGHRVAEEAESLVAHIKQNAERTEHQESAPLQDDRKHNQAEMDETVNSFAELGAALLK